MLCSVDQETSTLAKSIAMCVHLPLGHASGFSSLVSTDIAHTHRTIIVINCTASRTRCEISELTDRTCSPSILDHTQQAADVVNGFASLTSLGTRPSSPKARFLNDLRPYSRTRRKVSMLAFVSQLGQVMPCGFFAVRDLGCVLEDAEEFCYADTITQPLFDSYRTTLRFSSPRW